MQSLPYCLILMSERTQQCITDEGRCRQGKGKETFLVHRIMGPPNLFFNMTYFNQ